MTSAGKASSAAPKALPAAAGRDRAGGAAAKTPSLQYGEAPPGLESAGNQQMLRALGIHRALAISAPTDPDELEADRAANAFARGAPFPGISSADGSGGSIHRQCTRCEEEQAVRRREDGGAAPRSAGRILRAIDRSEGRPFAQPVRREYEAFFRSDLSSVRIHTDDAAHEAARSASAVAFARGNDVFFKSGQYDPSGALGRKLIAHELAHTLQPGGHIARQEEPVRQTEPAAGFDPCGVNVATLDNRTLLQYSDRAERYIQGLIDARRRGEERYYDYGNLLRRLSEERGRRASAGHVWLNARLADVPSQLFRLESAVLADAIRVEPADTEAAAENRPVGNAVVITTTQFYDLLARERIPMVDPREFFAMHEPGTPLMLSAPPREETASPIMVLGAGGMGGFASPSLEPQFGGGLLGEPEGAFPLLFSPAIGAGGLASPQTAAVFDPFARPVVTAGPFGFGPEATEGFRTAWRGDVGEARFIAQDEATLRAVQDLNLFRQDFPLYDVLDPRIPRLISIKTQLPTTPGGEASLETMQLATRELFGRGNPAKRAQALTLLQATVDPTLTMDRMLLITEIAVNPEAVAAAQDSIENAIRRGQMDYEPLLSAMLQDQSIAVQLRDGSTRTYTDFGSLRADYDAGRIVEARYRAAVAQLAQRARGQIVSNASEAEAHLRPLLDYRQQFDFRQAAEFAQFADSPEGRHQARALQELYFRRIAVPELIDVQTGGMSPLLRSSARTGTAMGTGTTAVLQLPHLVQSWETDPYAGRRYLTGVALSGAGGGGQAVAEQAWRVQTSRWGLQWAASRAAAGQSVAPVAGLTPLARFGGSSALGGVASGGITVGGMFIDERYFGADYTTIDYGARGTRAFVSGTVASGAGALATAGTVAYLAGGGGAAGCTVIVPGLGTVACGAVGLVGGFIVGLGAYYLFDYTVGESIESGVRDAMGEGGCTD